MASGKLTKVISNTCFILGRYTVYNKQIVWKTNSFAGFTRLFSKLQAA